MFSIEDARKIGDTLGIDWASSPFDVEQFLAGLKVELEHGRRDAQTDGRVVRSDTSRKQASPILGVVSARCQGLAVPRSRSR